MDADIRKLNSLNDALKRNMEQAKKIRSEKKIVSERLYKNMERKGINEYSGIKIAKVTPKLKAKRKKPKEKKQDAIRLFTEIGVPDPEEFWNEFQETQKYILPGE